MTWARCLFRTVGKRTYATIGLFCDIARNTRAYLLFISLRTMSIVFQYARLRTNRINIHQSSFLRFSKTATCMPRTMCDVKLYRWNVLKYVSPIQIMLANARIKIFARMSWSRSVASSHIHCLHSGTNRRPTFRWKIERVCIPQILFDLWRRESFGNRIRKFTASFSSLSFQIKSYKSRKFRKNRWENDRFTGYFYGESIWIIFSNYSHPEHKQAVALRHSKTE